MSSINGLLKAILQHRYQRLQIVSALLIFGELNTEGNELENIKKGMNLNYVFWLSGIILLAKNTTYLLFGMTSFFSVQH